MASRKGSVGDALANRVIAEIIRNSTDSFRQYLQQSVAPSPVPLAGGGYPEVPPWESPVRVERTVPGDHERTIFPSANPSGHIWSDVPFPDVRVEGPPAVRMPQPGDMTGPNVRFEDGSTGPGYRIPVPGIPRPLPVGPEKQRIDTILRMLGLA